MTHNKGLVSIIVPCYNGEPYINRFIDSLIKQTYNHIQFIIVNDGSTDDSEAVILNRKKSLLVANIDLVYIKKENGGIGSAIQSGLKAVTGEYLVWYNIDDILLPDAIYEMKKFLDDNPNYGVVRPDAYISDELAPYNILYCINDNNPDKFKPYQFKNAVTEHNFNFGCSMIRMVFFDRINPSRYIYQSRQGQNWQILLPMFYYYKSGYIDKPLYYVVVQKESTSSVSDPKKKIEQIKEYEKILIETLTFMNIKDGEKYILDVHIRFAHRLFRWSKRLDYSLMKEEYLYLKKMNQLTVNERREYRKRVWHIEYWLYIKHKIFG